MDFHLNGKILYKWDYNIVLLRCVIGMEVKKVIEKGMKVFVQHIQMGMPWQEQF